MPKPKRNPRKRRTWRDVPDEILFSRNINGSVFDQSESLRPSEGTMIRYCDGVEEAIEIVHSYRLLAPTIMLAEIA